MGNKICFLDCGKLNSCKIEISTEKEYTFSSKMENYSNKGELQTVAYSRGKKYFEFRHGRYTGFAPMAVFRANTIEI